VPDDPNYHDVDDQVGLNCRGAADDLVRNCERDVLVDLNYRDAADDHDQSYEPDARNDRDALGVRDDPQHLLGVADDFPLRMDALVDLCARHYFCEVRDRILVYRRVAWHIDAIAKNTNQD
jgi:hypothetical protein